MTPTAHHQQGSLKGVLSGVSACAEYRLNIAYIATEGSVMMHTKKAVHQSHDEGQRRAMAVMSITELSDSQ
jgi:hypothetical protein